MVGHAGSPTGIVHADVTLTRSKVKVMGLLNSRKLAKPCMLAAMTVSPLAGLSGLTDILVIYYALYLHPMQSSTVSVFTALTLSEGELACNKLAAEVYRNAVVFVEPGLTCDNQVMSAVVVAITYLPFPQIDIIGAMMIVWRVRGKIITSVLCSIVCNTCAQCNQHTHEQTYWLFVG